MMSFLSRAGWLVNAGQTLHWLIEKKTAGIDGIFPSMRTDIVLDHVGKGRRIIIDTKFNSVLIEGGIEKKPCVVDIFTKFIPT